MFLNELFCILVLINIFPRVTEKLHSTKNTLEFSPILLTPGLAPISWRLTLTIAKSNLEVKIKSTLNLSLNMEP